MSDLDDKLEQYRIPGTNGINWSRYVRENEPHEPPKYKVGDIVAYLVIGEITRVYEDCDGSPLYTLDDHFHGVSEGNLRPATDDERSNKGFA